LVAKEFITILLTEKWLESAQMMQLLCIGGAFAPISGIFSSLIITRGHSATYMWCSIALCLVQLAAAFVAAPYGIHTMITLNVAISIGWILVWHHFAFGEVNIHLWEVAKDTAPYFFLSAILISTAYWLTKSVENLYLALVLKILIVAIPYSLSLWMLNSTIFKEAFNFLIKRKPKI
jgi:O-antigen/teichoic acid export membrane protein